MLCYASSSLAMLETARQHAKKDTHKGYTDSGICNLPKVVDGEMFKVAIYCAVSDSNRGEAACSKQ